jgi:predicted GH43/DUF377 family glycosyl hydrolase
MSDLAKISKVVLRPDSSRTVIRPFVLEDPEGFAQKDYPRSQRIIDRVLSLDAAGIKRELELVAKSLDDRHRDPNRALLDNYKNLDDVQLDRSAVSDDQALLIGAYFSEEFSFESAALFNPSIVRHPDQSGAKPGDTRFVLSLRGIGEGHISSLAFRTGTWGADNEVKLEDISPHAMGPLIERAEGEKGELIAHLSFEDAESISEAVVYPFMPSQGRGIEDLRLVEFTEDDGATDYRGTYTAFNGSDVRQGILRTADFKHFEMRGVQGQLYAGKGMALFPRKIDGRYVMFGRQDNENIWLLTSDDLYTWNGGEKIITPKYPWEFIQIGNCGSPIEIEEGWLAFTHGVGVVRNYCVGACLLDKKDPSKVLARLEHPLLEPDGEWRDGYVPNVVYSCGALVRDRQVLLPYGVADNFAAFATIDLDRLLAAMG